MLISKLIQILRWMPLLAPILNLPDWSVSESVRQWVIKVLGVAKKLAEETETEKDDQAVAALLVLVNDEQSWIKLHATVQALRELLMTGSIQIEDITVDHQLIRDCADDVKIDPIVIVSIIQMILELIKWWKNR